jgi:hypothetical protein
VNRKGQNKVNNVEDYNEVVKGTEGYVRNMQEYGDGEGVSMRGHVDEITELWWDVGMTCELDLTECTKEVINIPHMENNDQYLGTYPVVSWQDDEGRRWVRTRDAEFAGGF